jgi:transcription-repair coupling factor (superfamily II helicase)
VLVLAESAGRAKACWTFLRASGLSPPAFDSLAEFLPAAKARHRHRRADQGFAWLEGGLDFVTETELFAAGPPRAGAASRNRSAMSRR